MKFAWAAVFAIFCGVGSLAAQSVAPDNTATATTAQYSRIIKERITRDYPGMLHQPSGSLTHPFITPGSVYASELWDWDSWLSDIVLCQILSEQGKTGADLLAYGQGCVLNFLEYSGDYIPINLRGKTDPKSVVPPDPEKTNMHKPVLAQHAAFLTKLGGGDAAWLREKFPNLQAFIKAYRERQRHAATGLYFWRNDLAIGVDDDPSTFFRPADSSGSIYLNCLMYKELQAMAYLADRLGLPKETAEDYTRQAEELKAAIQKNCWDERDGFFYSVDLNLLPITKVKGHYLGKDFVLHAGHPRDYDCLIQRLGVWSGFLAMWAGIATPEQAKRMVTEHLENEKTLGAAYGVRTLSKMEKMYSLHASGNPSNWHGPIWGISNYMVYQGLRKYGFDAEAKTMAAKTIELFGRDYEQNDKLHEYYNPDTGEGIMNPGFQNWNYLVMNMLAWLENRPVVEEF